MPRRVFWCTAAAYWVLYAVAFAVPFETAYQLQCDPESLFVQVCFWGWVLLAAASVIPWWRAAGRRLNDAGLSSIWRALIFIPGLGWLLLVVLLLLPSQKGLNRYDRLPEQTAENSKNAPQTQ